MARYRPIKTLIVQLLLIVAIMLLLVAILKLIVAQLLALKLIALSVIAQIISETTKITKLRAVTGHSAFAGRMLGL